MRSSVLKHKALFIFIAFFFALLSIPALPETLYAKEKIVRVGWFMQPGYMEVHKNGSLYGYNYEYLQNIARCTGWRYQFVHGSFEDLIKKLSAGEIDILGCVFLTKERTSFLGFPSYSAGEDYITLFTSIDSELSPNDFKSFNGIKVGGTTRNNLRRLEEFAAENNFNVATKLYSSFQELISAIDSGVINVAVYGSFQPDPAYKSLASFAPSFFYFATTKGNREILSGLNRAMSSIKLYNPYYDRDLSKRYLPREYARFSMTESEKEFVASSPEILVAHGSDWPPFEEIDDTTGEYKGICRDLFDKVSEISGLKFKYYRTSNVGGIDREASVISSMINNFDEAYKSGFYITDPYLKIPMILIRDTSRPVSSSASTAISRHNCMHKQLREMGYTLVFYDTIEECLDAVKSGEVHQALINSIFAEHVLKKTRYKNLTPLMIQNRVFEPCVGVRENIDPRLFSILNKAVLFISQAEMNNIIAKNTINLHEGSFMSLLEQIPMDIFLGIGLSMFLIILLLLFLVRSRSRYIKKINNILYTDNLTGALSQYGFEKRSESVLAVNTQKLYIVDFDISRFENYNLVHGSEKGNLLLKEVVRIIKADSTKDLPYARIYADHFVTLVESESQEAIKNGIIKCDEMLKKSMGDNSIIVNYGIYEITDRSMPIKEMIARARAAKRTVKGNVENYVGFYNKSIHDKEREDGDIIACMNECLAKGEFVPYYQPKYDAQTETLIGAEALVRWIRSDGTMVSPDRFIRLFERNGQIMKLDFCMLDQVCKTQREFLDSGIAAVAISVNFSAVHLYSDDFVESINRITEKYNVPHNLIEIEFTESAMIENLTVVKTIIHILHESGYMVAMDDFGSGYSSLNVLKELSVDVVKLDREFLQFDEKTVKGELVVQSAIRLAKDLSLITVAEGVEKEPQLEFLRRCGCDIIQGYYFSKPVNHDTYKKMLKRQ